ncbi:MAG TPA: group 1 truncated hemoglobin [Candidatus Udaeobacter sp.]|jgi:hemoglobin|nr:group 1 truncated hemoglobin [Candidatus Udaeobacter sp.]
MVNSSPKTDKVTVPQFAADNQTHSDPIPPQTSEPCLFAQLGGEDKLREIIGAFIDRVFEDRMIGFFFRHADRNRIKEMEYQLTANFLGAGTEYQGRPLDKAHARHPIMGGHFARRRQILKETLESYGVPEPVKAAWLKHTDALRPLITPEAGSGCDPIAARQRVNKQAAGEL